MAVLICLRALRGWLAFFSKYVQSPCSPRSPRSAIMLSMISTVSKVNFSTVSRISTVAIALAIAGSPLLAQDAGPNTLTPSEQRLGWQLLFDGKTLDKWRGYAAREVPAGWQVVDG